MKIRGLSPTQRTLAWLRERGVTCDVVERFNQYAGPFGKRHDFLGFADIVGCEPGRGIVAWQSCGQDFRGHELKLLNEATENCAAWLRAGGRIELVGWRKLKLRRGMKALRWMPRVRVFKLEDFEHSRKVKGHENSEE